MLTEGFLLLRISVFAAVVPLLARVPIRRLATLLEPVDLKSDKDVIQAQRVIRLTDLVCRVGRPLIARRCLTRGFTLYYFLRRAGIDVSLVFGVGKFDEAFAGHCWLVRDGEPYLETVDPRPLFTAMHALNHSMPSERPDLRIQKASE